MTCMFYNLFSLNMLRSCTSFRYRTRTQTIHLFKRLLLVYTQMIQFYRMDLNFCWIVVLILHLRQTDQTILQIPSKLSVYSNVLANDTRFTWLLSPPWRQLNEFVDGKPSDNSGNAVFFLFFFIEKKRKRPFNRCNLDYYCANIVSSRIFFYQ